MSPYLVVPLLALIAILQTTLIPMFVPGSVRPDLMLIVVVSWGVVHGDGQAALWGLGGGICLDLLSGAPFGLNALTLGGVGLLADSLQTNFFRANIFIPPAIMFVAALLFHIAQAGALQTLGYPINWAYFSFGVVLPTALLDTALMPIVYWLLRRIDHVVRPRLTW